MITLNTEHTFANFASAMDMRLIFASSGRGQILKDKLTQIEIHQIVTDTTIRDIVKTARKTNSEIHCC